MTFINRRLMATVFISLVSLGAAYGTLHTFSHDSANPSQKLHADLNDAFARHWKARTGADISVRQAQSKSGKPIYATVDGLNITTLALSYDKNTLGGSARFVPPGLKPLPRKFFEQIRSH